MLLSPFEIPSRYMTYCSCAAGIGPRTHAQPSAFLCEIGDPEHSKAFGDLCVSSGANIRIEAR
jgi:hypothetical protein